MHQHRVSNPEVQDEAKIPPAADRLLFLAERQSDGTYSITLTEEGIQTFETALGIADDLGGKTRLSPYSTIADIMERTATREELSQVLRMDRTDMRHRLRIMVLRRKLRGSEQPAVPARTVGHLGKIIIVALIGIWTLMQFGTAVMDIAAIPGILANIPNDIIQLHPTSAFTEVGDKIADAGQRVLFGILGAILTYIVAKLIRPLARMYRNDQLIVGERVIVGLLARILRKADERRRHTAAP